MSGLSALASILQAIARLTGPTYSYICWLDLSWTVRKCSILQENKTYLDLTFAALWNLNLVESNVFLAMESQGFHHGGFHANVLSLYPAKYQGAERFGLSSIPFNPCI